MIRIKSVIVVALAALVGMGGQAYGQDTTDQPTDVAKVRVGTFDSRALAMAYYRSDEFASQLKALREEYDKAKAEGDEDRVAELEKEGPAMQAVVHKQGFSTWPVDNILAKITDKLPDIATDADVDLMVSKWDIAYQRDGVSYVDVTDQLVELFHPDEETLGIIADIRKQAPVALEDLKDH